MKLILVRHGQTTFNERNIFRGRLDIPLNEAGIQQADAVAERLSRANINIIYSSPLKRALATAQIIAERSGIQAEIVNNLIDMDFGSWQGFTIENVQKQFSLYYEKWLKNTGAVRIPNGENLTMVKKRVNAVIKMLLKKRNSTIGIVSHRAILKVFICTALSLDFSYFGRIEQNVAAISILDYKDGVFSLSLLNDTCHLGCDKRGKEMKDF